MPFRKVVNAAFYGPWKEFMESKYYVHINIRSKIQDHIFINRTAMVDSNLKEVKIKKIRIDGWWMQKILFFQFWKVLGDKWLYSLAWL